MPQFRIRRPWTIAPRREEDDGEEQRQRRLLDRELERWRQQAPARTPTPAPQPAPRPQPEEEGPVSLRRLARGFAPEDVLERQQTAFRGEQPGAREATQFGRAI